MSSLHVPVASQPLQADPVTKLAELATNTVEAHPFEAPGSPTLSPVTLSPVTLSPVEKSRVWGLSFARLTMEETLDQIDELIRSESRPKSSRPI